VKDTEKENLNGVMEVFIVVVIIKEKLRVMDFTNGLMADFMKETGSRIKGILNKKKFNSIKNYFLSK
jgi:hypothetical protein